MLRRKSRRAITALCAVVTLAASIAVTANRTVVAQASALDLTIVADGAERHVHSSQTTVGAALRDAGVEVGPADLVYPKIDEQIRDHMKIRIVRVVDKVVLKEEPIAFKTRNQLSNGVRVGLRKVVSDGKRGRKHLYYQVRYVEGKEKKRELIRTEIAEKPQDKVVLIGERGAGISRGYFVSRNSIIMHATAYDPGPRSCGRYATGRTCTGMRAGFGVVAVDPRVIRLGTKLYIEGYGYAIAADRGSAIKGQRIDLGYNTYSAAKRFGRKHVRVHVLE